MDKQIYCHKRARDRSRNLKEGKRDRIVEMDGGRGRLMKSKTESNEGISRKRSK